jgi:hypothetical protein
MMMHLGLAEDLAVIAFERYSRDQEPIDLSAAGK